MAATPESETYDIDKLIAKLGRELPGSEHIKRPNSPLDRILGLRYSYLEGVDNCWISPVDYMGNDRTPAKAARKSTRGADAEREETFKRDNGTTRHLIANKHTSPLESCEMRVETTGPIFLFAQILRHRMANVNVFSGRYSIFGDSFYIPVHLHPQSKKNKQMRDEFVILEGKDVEEFLHNTRKLTEQSFEIYHDAINKLGVSREEARFHLPQNAITAMSFKLDSHNAMHMADLRLAEDVMPETRAWMQKYELLMAIHTPMLHRHYVEYRRDNVTLSSSEAELILEALSGDVQNKEAIEKLREKIAKHKTRGALNVNDVLLSGA